MAKKRSTLRFMMIRDLLMQSFMIAFVMFLFCLMYESQGYEVCMLGDMLLLVVVGVFGNAVVNSVYQYDSFQMFHFTRKRFYRYQIVLVFIRAAELAIIRTVYQILLREDMIIYFMEDAEEAAGYYSQTPALWELLITNLFVFALIGQIMNIINTLLFNFTIVRDMNFGISLQHTQRIAEQKEKHPKNWKWMNYGAKLIGFIGMVAFGMAIIAYTDVQLSHPLYVRMIVMAVLVALWIVSYFVGKKRYVPKYI